MFPPDKNEVKFPNWESHKYHSCLVTNELNFYLLANIISKLDERIKNGRMSHINHL
jgi:hypothetical protein